MTQPKVDFTKFPVLTPGQNNCRALGTMKGGSNIIVEAQGMTVDEFSKLFLGRLDRPVINKTGLTGRFDFHLEYAPDETAPGPGRRGGDADGGPPVSPLDDPARGPSILTALQEQLGLKLERSKGPGEFLVIDHVEKPTEN
jgi:uncharacterized protein (TIGR03435 family)